MTASQNKPLVLGFVGATASGKSALAMQAALAFKGEIVCMDSMQIYRGMDIGTAKPSALDQEAVPHHMLDVADPKDAFSVAEYAAMATTAIEGIVRRGRLPILCGGTGLYLRALSRPMRFGEAEADPAVREKYRGIAEKQGPEALHQMLGDRDPKSAARLHPNDLRRVIRALEVQELTGLPFSSQVMPQDDEGHYDMRLYALDWDRQALYDRISQRTAQMLRAGLIGEVQSLLNLGVRPSAQAMQGLGYKETAAALLDGEDMKETQELIARRTRNYAKRQLTWFRADPRITWLGGIDPAESHISRVARDIREDT